MKSVSLPPPPSGLPGGSSRRHGDDKGGDDGNDGAPIVVNGEGVEEDFAEQQRRMMRVALARHMKRELIENEQDRLTKVYLPYNKGIVVETHTRASTINNIHHKGRVDFRINVIYTRSLSGAAIRKRCITLRELL